MARALRFGPFEVVSPVDGDAILDAQRLQALTAAVIEEAARGGDCVIVGRGAQCLLRRRPDVFHVFVYAPHEERVRRLRQRLGPDADVDSLIEQVDRERAAYVQQHFGCNWLDPQPVPPDGERRARRGGGGGRDPGRARGAPAVLNRG